MAGLVAKQAPIKWAQRKNSIYLTIDLRDITEEKIDLTPTKLSFSCKSDGVEYNGDLEFLNEVNPEDSTWKVLSRSIQMNIMKKEEDEEYWPRLLKDKNLEKGKVKLDWDKYVDEDEENGVGFDTSNLEGGSQFGGGGPPGMGGMPGMGGPGGMDMASMMAGMGGAGGPGGGMDMAAMQQMMASMGGGAGGPGGGMDMASMMAGMGGAGGPGGMDMGEEEDSDDDELPDLDADDDSENVD